MRPPAPPPPLWLQVPPFARMVPVPASVLASMRTLPPDPPPPPQQPEPPFAVMVPFTVTVPDAAVSLIAPPPAPPNDPPPEPRFAGSVTEPYGLPGVPLEPCAPLPP